VGFTLSMMRPRSFTALTVYKYFRKTISLPHTNLSTSQARTIYSPTSKHNSMSYNPYYNGSYYQDNRYDDITGIGRGQDWANGHS
jgi:hypothetical protein